MYRVGPLRPFFKTSITEFMCKCNYLTGPIFRGLTLHDFQPRMHKLDLAERHRSSFRPALTDSGPPGYDGKNETRRTGGILLMKKKRLLSLLPGAAAGPLCLRRQDRRRDARPAGAAQSAAQNRGPSSHADAHIRAASRSTRPAQPLTACPWARSGWAGGRWPSCPTT